VQTTAAAVDELVFAQPAKTTAAAVDEVFDA
jgi:hypothetical protein